MTRKQRETRSIQKTLMSLKQGIIERCLRGELDLKKAAELLNLHPKSLSRLKRRYLKSGPEVLLPSKTGPKLGFTPRNKTPKEVENLVKSLKNQHTNPSFRDLRQILKQEHGIKLNSSTIWRITKRASSSLSRRK